jgi:Protein of unknown function (DUF1778)
MSRSARSIKEPVPASAVPDVIVLPPPRPRRKGGVRRKAANPHSARIELRTTPATKAAIRENAKRAGATVTDYLLRNTGRRRAAPAAAVADPLILTRLLGELGKWGSNLNQLAHGRNMTGQEPPLDELRRIRVAASDMRAALLRALGHAD